METPCRRRARLLPYLEGWSALQAARAPSRTVSPFRSLAVATAELRLRVPQESLRLEKTARSELAEFRLATRNRQVCRRRRQPSATSHQQPATSHVNTKGEELHMPYVTSR